MRRDAEPEAWARFGEMPNVRSVITSTVLRASGAPILYHLAEIRDLTDAQMLPQKLHNSDQLKLG
jgi:hypothetical protein